MLLHGKQVFEILIKWLQKCVLMVFSCCELWQPFSWVSRKSLCYNLFCKQSLLTSNLLCKVCKSCPLCMQRYEHWRIWILFPLGCLMRSTANQSVPESVYPPYLHFDSGHIGHLIKSMFWCYRLQTDFWASDQMSLWTRANEFDVVTGFFLSYPGTIFDTIFFCKQSLDLKSCLQGV